MQYIKKTAFLSHYFASPPEIFPLSAPHTANDKEERKEQVKGGREGGRDERVRKKGNPHPSPFEVSTRISHDAPSFPNNMLEHARITKGFATQKV